MKKVVYISWASLTDKLERDWYLTHLRDNCVAVEYWDVAGLLFPGVIFQKSLERDYLTMVSSYKQLESLLAAKDVSQTNFMMLVNYEARFNRFFRLLTNFGCRLFYIEWGHFPTKFRSKGSNYVDIISYPRAFVKKVADRLLTDTSTKLGLVKPFDVVFAAGKVAMEMHARSPRKVAVNLCDYDNYYLVKEVPRLVDVNFAVFLDINLALQTDIKLRGWEYISAERYAAALNRFFGQLELKYGVNVVIAAHPKAGYDPDYFQGRRILKGLTPELVKDADFVISHQSTSISYAVLNRKPLLFIYTDDMATTYSETLIPWQYDIAEYLGQPIYNIDEVADVKQICLTEPDPVRYDLYKYNYLTSKESEDRLSRDIILAELTA